MATSAEDLPVLHGLLCKLACQGNPTCCTMYPLLHRYILLLRNVLLGLLNTSGCCRGTEGVLGGECGFGQAAH